MVSKTLHPIHAGRPGTTYTEVTWYIKDASSRAADAHGVSREAWRNMALALILHDPPRTKEIAEAVRQYGFTSARDMAARGW